MKTILLIVNLKSYPFILIGAKGLRKVELHGNTRQIDSTSNLSARL